jgi:uncharacterized protein
VSRYVLDSFAVLAWYNRESRGQRVRQLIRNVDNRFWMSVINLGEVYYRIAKEIDRLQADQVLRWMNRQSITIVDANRNLTLEAAKIKAQYTLSYADCFAAVLGRQLRAQVITGDREFLPLERDGVVGLAWL